jgi:hypothetical protein
MIPLAGSTHQTFTFPAGIQEAFAYYSCIERTLGFLTYVQLDQQHDADRFRMLYQATEVGLYRVRLYAEVLAEVDPHTWVITLRPVATYPTRPPRAALYGITAWGEFTSRSEFHPHPDGSLVDYFMSLKASLPVPLALRLLPKRALAAAAHQIVQRRIQEIVHGFIKRSVAGYQPSH